MKCPVCNDVRMREVDKNSVHIDVCPECKGVWLDRGELEKLMEGVREVRKEYDDWQGEKERYDSSEVRGNRNDSDDRYRERPPSVSHDSDDRYRNRPQTGSSSYYPKKKKNPILDAFSDLF